MVELAESSTTICVVHTKEARMRGDDRQQAAMWSYISPEQRVPQDHRLRPIRAMVDTILAELSPEFATLYAPVGRPSIPPEKLLRALLLQVLYSIRSERLLMEQLDYNLLLPWSVGLNMDDSVWDPTVFREEPRAAPGQGHRPGLLCARAGPGPAARVALGRALHGGRYPHRGVRESQEFHGQRRPARCAGRAGQSRGGLSWGAPEQRHAPLDHRSRSAAVAQRQGPRGQARLSRACAYR